MRTIFAVPGLHTTTILGIEQRGLSVVSCRTEAAAVYAAAACARVSNAGIVGVAILDSSDGLANALAAVKTAQHEQAAVLLLVGAPAMILKGRGAPGDTDPIELIKPHVKAVATVSKGAEVEAALRRLSHASLSGLVGVSCMSFPLETVWPRTVVP